MGNLRGGGKAPSREMESAGGGRAKERRRIGMGARNVVQKGWVLKTESINRGGKS